MTVTWDPASVAEVVTMQPELFAVGPREPALVEPGVVQAARDMASAPKHTGKIATRDEQRCVAAYAMLCAGVPRRQIARQLSMGRHTLNAIEAEYERGGKLAPLKDRVQRQLAVMVAEAAEEVSDTIGRGARDGEAAAWLKSVATALGIGYDKHALSTGGPTEIVEHKGPPAHQAVTEWWARVMPAVDVEVVPDSVTDSDSGGQPLQRNGLDGCATGLVTVSPAA
ncbi:MAG: hypothetical protein PWQ61_3524, partial [Betaproteobacteria bacterium]|nr:hypothetical protein [Betaproteobacteria bacterium]